MKMLKLIIKQVKLVKNELKSKIYKLILIMIFNKIYKNKLKMNDSI